MSRAALADARPGYGISADWLSPDHRLSSGWWVKGGSRLHRHVEATDLELGLRVRCHDCGAMARHNYRRATLDADGAIVVSEWDPLPWALDRLDTAPCEPLGQLALDLVGVR